MKHQETAQQIVQSVGGADNVSSVYHCVTRLRFELKDNSKADQAALKKLDMVMGTNISGEQFQVIIGNDVPKVYDEMVKAYPALKQSGESSKKEDGKKQNVILKIFETIAGVFAPMLPAITAAGILKGLLALFVTLEWLTTGTDTYRILSAIGDGVFYFLPLLIAFSAARKFGSNPFIAVGVSAALMYPDMGALLSSGNPVAFLNIPVTAVSYASSVIPILLAVWLLSYVEKTVDRFITPSLKLLLVPLISLLIMVPVTLIAIGPLGTFIGDGLSGGINWLLNEGGLISGIVLGGAMALIIMTGMHYALVPVIISNLATLGFDKFLPLTYISNMGQAGATLGVFFRAKDKKLKSVALSTSFTALMGVTEPAMYGVNMKYKKPFIAAMIGSSAGGGFALAFGAKAYALAGNGGIPGLPGLVGQTFWYAFGGMVIAFVVGAVVTVLLGIQEEADDAAQISGNIAAKPANEAPQSAAPAVVELEAATASADATAYAPMSGKAIPLKEVNDPTFGDELMGKGIAFVPAVGELVSPVSGTVMNVFKTKHALVIRDANGMELLIHVGINTVKLRGQFFEAHVQTGDQVQAGDKLLTFDLEQIAQNYDITTAMVVTNTADYKQILPIKLGPVGFGEPVLRAEL
ncbi:beta-glucoside-specific PTS transporter subunit IIABC [Paenibacillus typhae]|uniref:PTS system beta-glucoside-specific IIA component, Glc family /PTS system beta-glucoside-specific IIB component, Glc family /PTS system beta-glucoside-specific IIC component, Glc family n=1 Tax=Paenibacillus typhae TaxID=1174501 RepID=A0A1G8SDI3_9BACL|nr:beta-glucoside-specific PTS transporter subunit IIABC [Paenibacillus typhae]SDJ27288.1 PTS system beta-glucoside-specific IIA component, Glc family /PTS system beta-glucoside-specific IIB component, Glc family /PTS system beta-glucoside-specific IIC component, Glc family [Paenibacillus typhae]